MNINTELIVPINLLNQVIENLDNNHLENTIEKTDNEKIKKPKKPKNEESKKS